MSVCFNDDVFKIIFIVFKYVIPCLFLFIGLIKFICISDSSKAIKKFLKYFFIGLILFLISFIVQLFINNKCDSYNIEDNNVIDDNKVIENVDDPIVPVVDSNSQEEEVSIETIDGVTYVDGIMIVNKTYGLPSDYRPANSSDYEKCNTCLTQETLDAFNMMKTDASVLGLNLYISSGFRSYSYQNRIYNNYVSRDGKVKADTYSARPGHSEHQTGLAFDLNSIDDSFAYTAEGKWVQENCYRYGLILRYPKGKENVTGYQYESWHLRYVGKELASELYNDGNWITLEEYYNLTSVYE